MESEITALLITGSIIVIWLIVLSIILLRMVSKYDNLTKGIKRKELRELLEKANSKLKKQEEVSKELESWIKKIEKEAEFHVQKVGFIRFNPFSDTGGNQSFCLTLLDQNNNGVVISSLHSREQTRIYAKAIKGGKTTEGLELSKEELEAIKRAKER